MNRPLIAIKSQPRSGQVWLTRLLSDALDSPAVSWLQQDRGKDIATLGTEHRLGPYRITRGHGYTQGLQEAPDALVYMIRDPRDLVASTARFLYPEYADRPNEQHLLAANRVTESWDRWARLAKNRYDLGEASIQHVAVTTYEALRADAAKELLVILAQLDIPRLDYLADRVHDAAARHEFGRTKARIESMPTPKDANGSWLDRTNKRHIGKGLVGGWRDALPLNLAEVVMGRLDPELLEYFGYV